MNDREEQLRGKLYAGMTKRKKPSPEDLANTLQRAENETYDLYCIGQRWKDRARKAEYLNTELVETLKAAQSLLADLGHSDDVNWPVFQRIVATLERYKKAMSE